MIFAKVMDDAEGEWKAMDQGTILVDLYMKQSHDVSSFRLLKVNNT